VCVCVYGLFRNHLYLQDTAHCQSGGPLNTWISVVDKRIK